MNDRAHTHVTYCNTPATLSPSGDTSRGTHWMSFLRDTGMGAQSYAISSGWDPATPDAAHDAYAERNDCANNPNCEGLPAQLTGPACGCNPPLALSRPWEQGGREDHAAYKAAQTALHADRHPHGIVWIHGKHRPILPPAAPAAEITVTELATV